MKINTFHKILYTCIAILLGLFFISSNYSVISDATGNSTNINSYIRLLIISLIIIQLTFFNNRNFSGLCCSSLCKLILIWTAYVSLNFLSTFWFFETGFISAISSIFFWIIIFFWGCHIGYYIDYKVIRFVFTVILPVLILFLFLVSNFRTSDLNDGVASINSVMYPLLLLPWLLLYKNEISKLFFLLFMLFISFYSMKRSTSLAVILVFVFYIYYVYLKPTSKSIMLKISIAVFAVVLGVLVINYVNASSEGYLQQRFDNIEEDKGSGRLDIYKKVIDSYAEANIFNELLGSGFNSVYLNYVTYPMSRLSAHNDFLEILYDYGIIGLMIYILIVICLIKRYLSLKKTNSFLFIPYGVSLLFFIVLSMVSHLLIYPTYFVSLSLLWGYTEGYLSKQKLN